MRSRLPSPNVLPDQFESLTRVRSFALLKERAAESGNKTATLFISHPPRMQARARARAKGIMETNRLRVEKGATVSLPTLSLAPPALSATVLLRRI